MGSYSVPCSVLRVVKALAQNNPMRKVLLSLKMKKLRLRIDNVFIQSHMLASSRIGSWTLDYLTARTCALLTSKLLFCRPKENIDQGKQKLFFFSVDFCLEIKIFSSSILAEEKTYLRNRWLKAIAKFLKSNHSWKRKQLGSKFRIYHQGTKVCF